MIVTKNRIAKDKTLTFITDVNYVIEEFESYYEKEFYQLLNSMKNSLSIDDIQQSMALGELTPQARKKMEDCIDNFTENNMATLLDNTAQWSKDNIMRQIPDLDFSVVDDSMWFSELKRNFKRQMVEQQEKVIIESAKDLRDQTYYDNIPDRRLAELINYGSGLDNRSCKAGVNFYNNQLNNGAGKVKALKAAKAYYRKKYRQRAETLALDNLLQTHKMVEYRSVGEGIKQGIFSDIVKQWQSCEDNRVCKICREVNRKIVGYDEPFYLINGKYADGIDGAHSLCRCAILYIEKELIDEGIFDPYS